LIKEIAVDEKDKELVVKDGKSDEKKEESENSDA